MKLVDKSQFENQLKNPLIEKLLPTVVKRLIKSSAQGQYRDLRIPDGESYRDKGLDGYVTLLSKTDILPEGKLAIEIGATSDLKTLKKKPIKNMIEFLKSLAR